MVLPIGPELDLHAFSPRDVPSVVEEYVTAAHAKGLRDLRVVHGRGRSVETRRVADGVVGRPTGGNR